MIMKQESVIRNILKSEITWGVFLIAALWGVVQTVILPLQSMQINLAQIQRDITEMRTNASSFDQRINNLSDRVIVLEQKNK